VPSRGEYPPSLTVRGLTVQLTRNEARRAADALRACAMSAIDDGACGGWIE
jgi:hypothetical protein